MISLKYLLHVFECECCRKSDVHTRPIVFLFYLHRYTRVTLPEEPVFTEKCIRVVVESVDLFNVVLSLTTQ